MNKSVCIIITSEFGEKDFTALKKSEFKVFFFPMIKTISEHYILNDDDYEFLVFTSKNGIRYFFDSNKKIDQFRSKKIICLGTKTEEFLHQYKLKSFFTSPKSYSKIMLKHIIERGFINGKKTLLVQH